MTTQPTGSYVSWKKREAYRCARAEIDVSFLTVRDALTKLRLSLDTAQRLLAWRQQTERRA